MLSISHRRLRLTLFGLSSQNPLRRDTGGDVGGMIVETEEMDEERQFWRWRGKKKTDMDERGLRCDGCTLFIFTLWVKRKYKGMDMSTVKE